MPSNSPPARIPMNTMKCYFNGKMMRVIFEWDPTQRVYWFLVLEDPNQMMYHVFQAREIDLEDLINKHWLCPIDVESWLTEQGMKHPEDDIFLFNMRWNSNG